MTFIQALECLNQTNNKGKTMLLYKGSQPVEPKRGFCIEKNGTVNLLPHWVGYSPLTVNDILNGNFHKEGASLI